LCCCHSRPAARIGKNYLDTYRRERVCGSSFVAPQGDDRIDPPSPKRGCGAGASWRMKTNTSRAFFSCAAVAADRRREFEGRLEGKYMSELKPACAGRLRPPERNLLRAASLLVPQGDHGIDLHRAAGGDVAGSERDEHEQQCDGRKCCGIHGAHAIQQSGKKMR
jgi:hypothetical protein